MSSILMACSEARWAALLGLSSGLHAVAFLALLPEAAPAPGAHITREPATVQFVDPEPVRPPECAQYRATDTPPAAREAIYVSCTLGARAEFLPPAAAAAPPAPPPAPLGTPGVACCRETEAVTTISAAARARAVDPGDPPLEVAALACAQGNSDLVLCGSSRGGPCRGAGGRADGVPDGLRGGQEGGIAGGVPGGVVGGVLGGVPGGVVGGVPGGVVGGVPGGVLGGQHVTAEMRLPGRPVYPPACRRGECGRGQPCEGVSRWRITVAAPGARPSQVELLASAGCARLDDSVRRYLAQTAIPRAGVFILRFRFQLTDPP